MMPAGSLGGAYQGIGFLVKVNRALWEMFFITIVFFMLFITFSYGYHPSMLDPSLYD
jgi:hypothetical protein